MFYIVSKFLDFVLTPSDLIGIVGLTGIVVCMVNKRWGLRLIATATVLLTLAGWSPLGTAMLATLENRFPRPDIDGPVTGIILLGGAVDTHLTAQRGDVALNDGGERLTVVADLSQQLPGARIFLSGGAGHLLGRETLSESAAAKALLTQVGIPEERIEMEERSRNTCENAIETKRSLNPAADEKWILVTSASHMPRAVSCFRTTGLPVIPYPVDYRTGGPGVLSFPGSISKGLADLDLAAHEWIGLITYWVFGLTNELLPSPEQRMPG